MALRKEIEAARKEAETMKQELRVEKTARAEQVGFDSVCACFFFFFAGMGWLLLLERSVVGRVLGSM